MADWKKSLEESLMDNLAKRPALNFSKSLMSAYIEIKQEEDYLNGLADSLSISKKKNYTTSRNIVLNIHLKLERIIDFCIVDCLFSGAKEMELKADVATLIDVVSDIDFYKKLRIIKGLSACKPSSIKTLIKINNLRRAFAHGYKEEHKDYKYCGTLIFDKKTVEKLMADYGEISKEIYEGKIFE
ncbi:MAG: hypothetical protein KJ661_06125 [Candidatus Omnitrophica bacterium]|nr:hypothetical protein [Candidatus Omnitrophota bacterium]